VVLGLGAALTAAVLYGIASILQAVGSRKVSSSSGLSPKTLVRLLRQPAFLAALGTTMFGFLFHLAAVRTLPLFLAQTGIAVSLVVTALLAVRLFGDQLTRVEWGAVGGVVVGLVLLSSSAGSAGTERASHWLTIGLFATLVAMVIGGLIASRSRGIVSTAVLGLLGGLGYAVVGISARILPDFSIGDLLSSPATYSLGLGGGLAFLLYSLALQRGAVTAATTPLIATQTVTPAVVGVLLLGDSVRSGWWPGAVLGFLITGVSAIVLVRFEGVREVEEDEVIDGVRNRREPPEPTEKTTSAEFVPDRDGE
jgi:drug/metabolite transporter (DMT)-like permease